MKKIQIVQVFLVGDDKAYESGILVKVRHCATGTYVTSKEDVKSEEWTHYFPKEKIVSIRFFEEDNEKR